jgi:hypothetical protein
LERVPAPDVVVVATFVEVVFAEDFVLAELKIVVKGFKSPDIVKIPSPVWQSHFARGSLSQQNPSLPQLTTPASERELYKPAVALSVTAVISFRLRTWSLRLDSPYVQYCGQLEEAQVLSVQEPRMYPPTALPSGSKHNPLSRHVAPA